MHNCIKSPPPFELNWFQAPEVRGFFRYKFLFPWNVFRYSSMLIFHFLRKKILGLWNKFFCPKNTFTFKHIARNTLYMLECVKKESYIHRSNFCFIHIYPFANINLMIQWNKLLLYKLLLNKIVILNDLWGLI